MLVNSSVKHYCAQFYRPKLDNKIKEGDHILKLPILEENLICYYGSSVLIYMVD